MAGKKDPNYVKYGTFRDGKVWTKDGWVDYKPKSGAKHGFHTKKSGLGTKKLLWVNAWNASKSKGLVKFSAFENKRSKEYKREDGTTAISLLFEVFYSRTGNKVLELGFFNINTGKVVLGKTGFIISTKSPNGGYCGTYRKK